MKSLCFKFSFGLFFSIVLMLMAQAKAATFTVTNTNDSGTGSLRQVITDAATASGVDAVAFNIAGGGVKKIALLTELPNVGSTNIDATTQPGWSVGNLMIELSGENLTDENARGLKYFSLSGASPVFVRGLIINRFQGDAIYIQDSQNLSIEGCFIGTDTSGTIDLGNSDGIEIRAASTFTEEITIGGDTAAERNVISGNGLGIRIFGGNSFFIKGNYIGTDKSGNAALPNGSGMQVTAILVVIGGATTAERNVISGNSARGIILDSSQNTVQNNYIGVGANGFTPLGNGTRGIDLINSINFVNTGSHLISDNVIAFNKGGGITTFPANKRPTNNKITNNSIYDNNNGSGVDELGIDLETNGVTANDTGDADTGANNLQNFPVISAAEGFFGGLKITGTINSTANTRLRVELYGNPTCDASGNGEGKIFIGSLNITTDGSGNVSFNFTSPISLPNAQFVVATATNANSDTSEFSQNRQILVPTAANVAIQGRVLSNDGRAISKAMLTLIEPNGNVRNAMTNPFGYFQFTEVPAGETYTLNVNSKTYDFIPSVFIINLNEEITDFTIIGTWRENLNENKTDETIPIIKTPTESQTDSKKTKP